MLVDGGIVGGEKLLLVEAGGGIVGGEKLLLVEAGGGIVGGENFPVAATAGSMILRVIINWLESILCELS